MNTSVQKALDKYELHLQTLIESVSSYNPSPAAAQALIQADDELTATLEKRICPTTPSAAPAAAAAVF